jgi:hypothetical protein
MERRRRKNTRLDTKPLLCDFIAYAILPAGKAYLCQFPVAGRMAEK